MQGQKQRPVIALRPSRQVSRRSQCTARVWARQELAIALSAGLTRSALIWELPFEMEGMPDNAAAGSRKAATT